MNKCNVSNLYIILLMDRIDCLLISHRNDKQVKSLQVPFSSLIVNQCETMIQLIISQLSLPSLLYLCSNYPSYLIKAKLISKTPKLRSPNIQSYAIYICSSFFFRLKWKDRMRFQKLTKSQKFHILCSTRLVISI